MAEAVPARLTAAEGRSFGLTVGIAFVVLAVVLRGLRGAVTVPAVFAVVGGLLCVAGLLVPTRLASVRAAWMKLAHIISRVTTPIFMGGLYFLVLTPTGVFRRMIGRNALVREAGRNESPTGSYWVERSPEKRRGDLKRQF
jgi:hypothetical protein